MGLRTVDLIQKKRDGHPLTADEITYLIQGYVSGDIPDYQLAAWAMAVYFQGMNAEETAHLTMAMAASGDQIDLSAVHGIKVDKHSTGGVGDTTTLVLVPLVAAVGVPVAKMSGRGLGHTGGTIDKLESIPGFQVEQSQERFLEQINRIGAAVISQSGDITPADKKLYALRDVTATVESIPLIASSIMSKKIASGADAMVLDVKTGQGAFMKSLDDAIALAQAMVAIGTEVGRETVAIISDMEQPLGRAIGNALEMREAIETLQGKGPADLQELCLKLGANMMLLSGRAATEREARAKLEEAIRDGQALAKLKELVEAQGGNAAAIDEPQQLPAAQHQLEVKATRSGFVHGMAAEEVGIAAMLLGAGRATKESEIDLAAGVMLEKKPGDQVAAGETLAVLHYSASVAPEAEKIARRVEAAYDIRGEQPGKGQLIYAVVTKEGVRKLT